MGNQKRVYSKEELLARFKFRNLALRGEGGGQRKDLNILERMPHLIGCEKQTDWLLEVKDLLFNKVG